MLRPFKTSKTVCCTHTHSLRAVAQNHHGHHPLKQRTVCPVLTACPTRHLMALMVKLSFFSQSALHFCCFCAFMLGLSGHKADIQLAAARHNTEIMHISGTHSHFYQLW